MIRVKTIVGLFFASILLSYVTIWFLESNGITVGTFENRQTQTTEFVREIYASGFPIKFYTPGGFDYGANLMTEGFIANTIVVFTFIFLIYISGRKLISKQE